MRIKSSPQRSLESDPKEKATNRLYRIKQMIKRTVLILTGCVALTAINHVVQRKVNRVVYEDGTPSHTDPETTRIINYLCGLGSITPEEQFLAIQRYVAEIYTVNSGNELPDNFNSNYDDLNKLGQFYTEMIYPLLEERFGDAASEWDLFKADLEDLIPQHRDVDNPDAYCSELWRFEEFIGAPRVRLTLDIPSARYDIFGNNMPNYNSLTHTMYVTHSPESYYDGNLLCHEGAHALQYNSEAINAYISAVRLLVGIFAESTFTGQNPISIRQERYDQPGNLEYEAHTIIAPRLLEQFPALNLEPNSYDHQDLD